MQEALGPSSSTMRYSLQRMESRADQSRRKVVMAVHALKTQALVSVTFYIFC